MDGISGVDGGNANLLWELLFSQDMSGGAQAGQGTDPLQGIGGRQGHGMSPQGSGSPNGMTYNNSGIVINININFNFVNAAA